MRDKSDGFVFFLVFFEFFEFLTTSSKIFEKTKKQKKTYIRRLYEAKHFPQIFDSFVLWVFFGFLEFFGY